MSKSKRQSLFIIGFSMILVSFILLYYALSQPRVSEIDEESEVYMSTTLEQSDYSATQASALSQSQRYDSAVKVQTTVSKKNTASSSTEISYPINLNTCTAEELKTISGIGDSRASAIIQYREYLGGYTSVEQIKNIKGIGDALYEKVSPYLTV